MANSAHLKGLSDAEFRDRVQVKRQSRMGRVDSMSPEMRELTNAYGLRVVDACMTLGVTKAPQIKHLVETILDEFSPTRGSHSKQGIRTEVVPTP